MTEFFKVVKESDNCEMTCDHCGSTVRGYAIVFIENGNEVQTSTTYGKEENAEEQCEALNWAYELGKGDKSKDGSPHA